MSRKYFQITDKSCAEEGVSNISELWAKVKSQYDGLCFETKCEFKVEKGENDDEVMTMIASTDDEDRHGDVVVQDFDLKWYKKNPVVLDSHNYDSIEHIIGKMKNIRIEEGKLKGDVVFAEMNPKGILAKALAKAGFLNASSIGFIPMEFDEKDFNKITKSELLEISMVSVPANARALFEKIAEETKKDIEVAEEAIKSETPIETVVETTLKIDKQKFILNSIAQALRDMNKSNMYSQREKALKAIRTL